MTLAFFAARLPLDATSAGDDGLFRPSAHLLALRTSRVARVDLFASLACRSPFEHSILSLPSLRRTCAAALLSLLFLIGQTVPISPPLFLSTQAADGCYSIAVSVNSPTGIAGCLRFGSGLASYYAAGSGVAMNFCTWTWRHTHGCGAVLISSAQTGRQVIAPVLDFCDCYTGTSQERIVDLQLGVLADLGLGRSAGIYPVTVEPAQLAPKPVPQPAPKPTPKPSLAPAVPHQAFDPFESEDRYPDLVLLADTSHQLVVERDSFAKCTSPSLAWGRIWLQTSGWTVLVLCDHL